MLGGHGTRVIYSVVSPCMHPTPSTLLTPKASVWHCRSINFLHVICTRCDPQSRDFCALSCSVIHLDTCIIGTYIPTYIGAYHCQLLSSLGWKGSGFSESSSSPECRNELVLRLSIGAVGRSLIGQRMCVVLHARTL